MTGNLSTLCILLMLAVTSPSFVCNVDTKSDCFPSGLPGSVRKRCFLILARICAILHKLKAFSNIITSSFKHTDAQVSAKTFSNGLVNCFVRSFGPLEPVFPDTLVILSVAWKSPSSFRQFISGNSSQGDTILENVNLTSPGLMTTRATIHQITPKHVTFCISCAMTLAFAPTSYNSTNIVSNRNFCVVHSLKRPLVAESTSPFPCNLRFRFTLWKLHVSISASHSILITKCWFEFAVSPTSEISKCSAQIILSASVRTFFNNPSERFNQVSSTWAHICLSFEAHNFRWFRCFWLTSNNTCIVFTKFFNGFSRRTRHTTGCHCCATHWSYDFCFFVEAVITSRIARSRVEIRTRSWFRDARYLVYSCWRPVRESFAIIHSCANLLTLSQSFGF